MNSVAKPVDPTMRTEILLMLKLKRVWRQGVALMRQDPRLVFARTVVRALA